MMDLSIGSYEAKTCLPELLRRAERGEEIMITRHGKPVARLVPATSNHDVKAAQNAADQLRQLARTIGAGPFDWAEWRQYRDEGRR